MAFADFQSRQWNIELFLTEDAIFGFLCKYSDKQWLWCVTTKFQFLWNSMAFLLSTIFEQLIGFYFGYWMKKASLEFEFKKKELELLLKKKKKINDCIDNWEINF